MLPVVPLVQSDCRIFLSGSSVERTKLYLRFLRWRSRQGKEGSGTATLGWMRPGAFPLGCMRSGTLISLHLLSNLAGSIQL